LKIKAIEIFSHVFSYNNPFKFISVFIDFIKQLDFHASNLPDDIRQSSQYLSPEHNCSGHMIHEYPSSFLYRIDSCYSILEFHFSIGRLGGFLDFFLFNLLLFNRRVAFLRLRDLLVLFFL